MDMENIANLFDLINQNAENLHKWIKDEISDESFRAEKQRIENSLEAK